MRPILTLCVALLFTSAAPAQSPFGDVVNEVNKKMVKIFGSGGFRGLVAYGTGFAVSPDGYIVTAASHLLDTQDLRVHLYDGRRLQAKLIVVEPEFDLALVKIDKVEDLPFFDIAEAAKAPLAQGGDWVLAFSNQFQIATRDEPMTVQKGVIAAYAKLHGRRGIFNAPFSGEVYVVDAITNNPGAAGGALTTRKGELLGIVGKELRNSLTETWINYALPVQAKAEIRRGEKVTNATVAEFIELAKQGKWQPGDPRRKPLLGSGGFHGIVLVPNPVDRTPPFVEEVMPNSPASKAGLRPDDLIIYVNGEQVISVKAFREIMDKFPPGTDVRLEVRRGDKLQTVDLKLVDLPKK